MSTLINTERETYESIWQHEAYGKSSPGERYADMFMEMTGAQPHDTVLDAGCGNGKGAIALEKRALWLSLCDITDVGLMPEVRDLRFYQSVLWDKLYNQVGEYKWVYCCDVLEHIPTPFTMLVVSRLLEVCDQGLFLSIFLEPDQYGVLLGKPLHRSIQSFVQWRDQLAAVGTVVECRDLGNVGIYLVKP